MRCKSLCRPAATLLACVALLGCGGNESTPALQPVAVVPPPAVTPITATVQATTNPLVARVTVQAAPPGAQVLVEFGSDTNYGRSTSVTNANAAGDASILVAGMRPATSYHLRAKIFAANGTQTAPDTIFTTGALPASLASVPLRAETTTGATPQPGIELLDPIASATYQPFATDLQGNIIWYYPWADFQSPLLINGLKQLPNGHFLAVIGKTSVAPLADPAARATSRLREFDLAGETVRELTIADLNAKLASAGRTITLEVFHHDVEVLPNGNWLVLANTIKTVNGVQVLGDVVVEVDGNLRPLFVWNEFDHFDPSVPSMQYPDWTHSNAITYSPTDGNFLVSIRHLHLIVKVDFQNGAGDGAVLWRLGRGGDFVLRGGTDPTDWQYAQHTPVFVSALTAGQFDLIMMDNGNERIVPPSVGKCGTAGNAPCYSTVPLFRIDEQTRTATILSRVTFPPALYNSFAGNASVLPNGNWKYNLAGLPTGSIIREVTPDAAHTIIWSLTTPGNFAYRSERMPSLYPGVTWN